MASTSEQIDDDVEVDCEGFQIKTNFYNVGMRLLESYIYDLAIDAFQRGAENGCVPCIVHYDLSLKSMRGNMIHLRLPWFLEGAIRGNCYCIHMLFCNCYVKTKPRQALSLCNYWAKKKQSLDPLHACYATKEEERKDIKKNYDHISAVCGKTEFDEGVTSLQKCGVVCIFYSYCGKECQLHHWQEGNHIGECRQLQILNEYHKPYAKEIRDAIKSGENPKEIRALQRLRNMLGLTRPIEEYEELVELLSDDVDVEVEDDVNDRYGYLVARRDGTVHIGSTPKVI